MHLVWMLEQYYSVTGGLVVLVFILADVFRQSGARSFVCTTMSSNVSLGSLAVSAC